MVLVGRKYVTQKSSDTTGNRSRDRPTSSAAPQPLRYPRPPIIICILHYYPRHISCNTMFILRSYCIVTASVIVTLRITSKVSQKAENFLASSTTTRFERKSVFHEVTETMRDRTILLLTSDAVREISRRKVDVDYRQNNGIKPT